MHALPPPRGPITESLFDELAREPQQVAPRTLPVVDDPLSDDDLQLALYVCYELSYRGFEGVDDRWEWEPSLLALRGQLERSFEEALLDAVPVETLEPSIDWDAGVDLALRELAERDGASLATFIQRRANAEQVREFVVHRSAYQLKEADPHSWAIPRLFGGPKAALIEIQADEYGGGRPEWIHAQLFARSMRALGLDDSYGAYLSVIPGVTLATVNQMSLFGLHRRWRGAIVGHLALFEMTSSIPNRRYGDGLRRLGFSGDATLFFDEHVEADAVHEQIAAVDLAAGLVNQEPAQRHSVLWGARTLEFLGERWASHVLSCWANGERSLLEDLELDALESPEALAAR